MELKNTKLLFLYRSILFKFIKFETKDKNLKPIVKALNIKNKKQRIEYIYDEAIKIINNYYSDDLCKFIDNKCIAARKYKKDKINGCCRLCIHQNSKGCKVNNLSCKLFYCKAALENIKKLNIDEIAILKCLNKRQRFILKSDYFSTREEVINDLYYGIIIATIRISYRLIKQLLKRKHI
ncbi:MAG: hypothetical protein IKG40_02215 [Bacilli bacterium]|nr:hypothetical protein [Bacilli bacterium]